MGQGGQGYGAWEAGLWSQGGRVMGPGRRGYGPWGWHYGQEGRDIMGPWKVGLWVRGSEHRQPTVAAAGDHVANQRPRVQVRVVDLHRVHRHRR